MGECRNGKMQKWESTEMEQMIDNKAGISNMGNRYRLKRLIRRAQSGESLKIAFLGGSVTQGSLASCKETCYATRVFAWWKRMFPGAEFTCINAGIGGTTSQSGCARVQKDVLDHDPDFVAVDFSVNDDCRELFLETYEGLIRRILSARPEPAVLIVHHVRYDNGANAQVLHAKIARHYRIPSVSMQSSVYPYILNGDLAVSEITPDGLHPNDLGHRMAADVITYFLEKTAAEADVEEQMLLELPQPLTANKYEAAVRYQNDYSRVFADGFQKDQAPQDGITDVFKKGWTADQAGARIVFELEASEIAVQYRRVVKKLAPLAEAVIDGEQDKAVLLDGNFDEDWGDCLAVKTLLYHGEAKKHVVEIRILQMREEAEVPFYLAAVLGSV